MKQSLYRKLVLCAAIAGLAVFGWLLGRLQHRVDRESDTPRVLSPARPLAWQDTALATATAPNPANARYTELIQAISRGDADAAYRFAQGRQACLDLRRAEFLYRNASNTLQSNDATAATAQERARQTDELTNARSKLERLRESCIGIEHVSDDEIHDDWARAANMGSRDAQYRYTLDPGLNLMSAGTDTERWRQWRDSAPRYLDNLLDEGDARAALALAAASDQNDCVAPKTTSSGADICREIGELALIQPQQEKISYMYYLLDRLLGDTANAAWVSSELTLLERSMTPEEIASAKVEAQRRFLQVRPGS